MAKMVLHDDVVSEVMSEEHSLWPGVRLIGDDLAPVEEGLLTRWEDEDRRDLLDLLSVCELSLAWKGA